MIRKLNVFLVLSLMVVMAGVYGLKFQSEGVARRKASLEDHIAKQKSDLSLLRADWAVLNQPAHIGPIVERHKDELHLAEIDPKQFTSIDKLPMRPAAPDPEAITVLLKALEDGVDPITALIEAN